MNEEIEILNKYEFWRVYSDSYSDEFMRQDSIVAENNDYSIPYIYRYTPERLAESAYGMTREFNDDWFVELIYRVLRKGKDLQSALDSIKSESVDFGGTGVKFLHPDPFK